LSFIPGLHDWGLKLEPIFHRQKPVATLVIADMDSFYTILKPRGPLVRPNAGDG